MDSIDGVVSGEVVSDDAMKDAVAIFSDHMDLDELPSSIIRKKNRIESNYGSKPQRRGESTEVYDRQLRMATQIADALNSVQNPNDKNYLRAHRIYRTLINDVRENGLELFANRAQANAFMDQVHAAISERSRVHVQIIIPDDKPYRPSFSMAYP